MAGPIARNPAGLLDLLLTQQQGKNPATLGDTLIPTLDLRNFYDADRFDTSSIAGAFTAVGQETTVTIPAGEAWRILSWSINGTFATVNQRVHVLGRLASLPNAATVNVKRLEMTPVAATDIFGGGLQGDMHPGIVYPSGTAFKAHCASINLDAQPSISVNQTLLYVRMES